MWLEIVCAVALLYGLVSGWSNGLVKELCSTTGFVLGCFLAWYGYTHYGLGLGWALVLCIGFPIVLGFVASLVSKVLEHIIVVGTLNHLLGALLGCVKYGLVIGLILNLMDKAPALQNLLDNVEAWKNQLL